MPPESILDSDLNPVDNKIIYAIEQRTIWKGIKLGGGNTEWTDIYSMDVFEEETGNTESGFSRVRCTSKKDTIYVIGYTLKAGQEYPNASLYCFKTVNGGDAWNYYDIGDALVGADTPFYFTGEVIHKKGAWGVCSYTASISKLKATVRESVVSYRSGAADWNLYLVMSGPACYWGPNGYTGNHPESVLVRITDMSEPNSPYSYPQLPPRMSLKKEIGGVAEKYDLGGGLYKYSPKEGTGGITVGFMSFYTHVVYLTSTSDFTTFTVEILEVNDEPVIDYGTQIPFDVARTNENWLYIGLVDKIIASEDGGVTWYVLYEEHGANDICVDPQLAGAIYYWSTEGELNLIVKSAQHTLVTELQAQALMTETPRRVPLRIGRDVNSGRLLALPNGSELVIRNLGANTTFKTGLSGACGIHCYAGQKIIFVDAGNIYISNNIQSESPTILGKKGTWSSYGSGINSHRIR